MTLDDSPARRARAFLNSRQTLRSTIIVVTIGLAGGALGGALMTLPTLTGGVAPDLPLALFVPVVLGGVIGLSTHSPAADLESLGARILAPWRIGQSVMLLGWAAVVTVVGLHLGGQDVLVWPALRNLCGFTGLTLLTVPLVGSALSFVLPLTTCLISLLIGVDRSGSPRPWAWPLSLDSRAPAWGWAAALLAIGLAVHWLLGPRFSPDDDSEQ